MNSNICPHLVNIAQVEDQPTFISPLNRCRAGDRETGIGGATQARLCLTTEHPGCPFASGALTHEAAATLRVVKPQRPSFRPTTFMRSLDSPRHQDGLRLLAGTAFILGLIVGLIFLVPRISEKWAVAASPNRQVVAITNTPSPSSTPTPTATRTDVPTPTPTATWTIAPTPTVTPTPLRPPAISPPTRLVIPALDVDIPVVEVGWKTVGAGEEARQVWNVADYAASFHRTSAYPGRPGNTVISGHNNIRGEVFRNLETLTEGDKVRVYVGEVAYPYRVAEIHILPDKWVSEEQKQENAKWIDYFPQERLTLVTCWPYEGNSHRVIVVAMPSSLTTGENN